MIILGIDPGSRRLGYGVIEHSGIRDVFIEAGVLGMKGQDDTASLKEIKKGLEAIIKKYRPDYISIEKLFFSKNQKTAMAVAQARGIALAATFNASIRIIELSPNEIKIGVTGYGHADKKAVLKMVRFILQEPRLAIIDDASDALAAALCAATRIGKYNTAE